MSVVVMYMQMPSECLKADESINRNCPMDRVWCAEKFAPYDMTYLQRIEEQIQKLPSWCPLRPLPDVHVRLIDADAFEAFVQEKLEQNEIGNGDWMSFREWLRDQKTIIEAEGD